MRLSSINIPRSEIERLLNEWVFNARKKTIFIKKLEGSTYEEIAEEYNLSVQSVKGIVKQTLNIILSHLK